MFDSPQAVAVMRERLPPEWREEASRASRQDVARAELALIASDDLPLDLIDEVVESFQCGMETALGQALSDDARDELRSRLLERLEVVGVDVLVPAATFAQAVRQGQEMYASCFRDTHDDRKRAERLEQDVLVKQKVNGSELWERLEMRMEQDEGTRVERRLSNQFVDELLGRGVQAEQVLALMLKHVASNTRAAEILLRLGVLEGSVEAARVWVGRAELKIKEVLERESSMPQGKRPGRPTTQRFGSHALRILVRCEAFRRALFEQPKTALKSIRHVGTDLALIEARRALLSTDKRGTQIFRATRVSDLPRFVAVLGPSLRNEVVAVLEAYSRGARSRHDAAAHLAELGERHALLLGPVCTIYKVNALLGAQRYSEASQLISTTLAATPPALSTGTLREELREELGKYRDAYLLLCRVQLVRETWGASPSQAALDLVAQDLARLEQYEQDEVLEQRNCGLAFEALAFAAWSHFMRTHSLKATSELLDRAAVLVEACGSLEASERLVEEHAAFLPPLDGMLALLGLVASEATVSA